MADFASFANGTWFFAPAIAAGAAIYIPNMHIKLIASSLFSHNSASIPCLCCTEDFHIIPILRKTTNIHFDPLIKKIYR